MATGFSAARRAPAGGLLPSAQRSGDRRHRIRRGPICSLESSAHLFRRTNFPGQSQALRRPGPGCYPSVSAIPHPVDLAVIATPPPPCRAHPRVRRCGRSSGHRHFRGVQGSGRARRGARKTDPGGSAARGMRIVGPNCLGLMSPHNKLNATFASTMARPGKSASSAKAARYVPPFSTGAGAKWSASALCIGRLDARCGLGRPDPISRRRSGDAQHRAVHGIGRRCAKLPVGRARSGAREADHRDQARAHTGRRQGRRIAHRRVDRAGRRFRRCISKMRSRCGWTPSPSSFLSCRSARQTAASEGPALGDRHQCRRAGRARYRRVVDRLAGNLRKLAPSTMEQLNAFLPRHWSHQNPIDVIGDAARRATPRPWRSPPRIRTPKGSGHSGADRVERSYGGSAESRPHRQAGGQARDRQLDGRPGCRRRPADAEPGRNPHLRLPGLRRPRSST